MSEGASVVSKRRIVRHPHVHHLLMIFLNPVPHRVYVKQGQYDLVSQLAVDVSRMLSDNNLLPNNHQIVTDSNIPP